jgi:hypothetical protein
MADDLMQEALEALSLVPSSDYEATPEEIEKYRLQALAEVDGLCGGEEAIAAANFSQVGPKGETIAAGLGDQLASYGLGGLARKGTALLRPKSAKRLPKMLLLAVTPKRLYLFDASYRYSVRPQKRKSGRPVEVASWDRDAIRVESAKPNPRARLRIEPLDGGTVLHLAGPGVDDDPWSLAMMMLLDPSPTSSQVR